MVRLAAASGRVKTSAKAQMERLSISIPPLQMAWLRAEADSLGVSLGELLRRIIDRARTGD